MNPTQLAEPSSSPRSTGLDGIQVHSLAGDRLGAHPRLGMAATSCRQQSVVENKSSLDEALRQGRLEIPQNRVLLDGRM
jgi:hypothetical protein